jgi:hypothetical protein
MCMVPKPHLVLLVFAVVIVLNKINGVRSSLHWHGSADSDDCC